MFQVRRQTQADDSVLVFQSESFEKARQEAEAFKQTTGSQYGVYEVKQVWTTQTLDEALES